MEGLLKKTISEMAWCVHYGVITVVEKKAI